MGFVLFFCFLAVPPFVFETPLKTHTHTHTHTGQLMGRGNFLPAPPAGPHRGSQPSLQPEQEIPQVIDAAYYFLSVLSSFHRLVPPSLPPHLTHQ